MNARLDTLRILHGDLEEFSRHCMRIIPKSGGQPVSFELNKAQLFVHAALEKMRAENNGKVRAIILKGRQQGISTLIGARFYHRTSMNRGLRASIIAHEQKASNNLYKLVKRYHSLNPLAPSTGTTNAQELIFDKLDSGYSVMTAGTEDVGRSATFQLGHLSEFAFWKNAELHIAGLGQTIADEPGTEIIIESTANGVGNAYHEYWQLAESGDNGFLPIFVPWNWQPEYTDTVPNDFEPTPEEDLLVKAYGLTAGQLVWRRRKIAGFGKGREWLFRQEYPLCPAEAFVTATKDPFITPDLVMASVNSGYFDKMGPLIIGVDPAEFGADRTAIAFRRGRVITRIEWHKGKNTMEVAGIVARLIKEKSPDAVFVDSIGIGAGIRDRLIELGFDRVFGVNSGQRAMDDDIYANKRAEMWGRFKAWLEELPNRMCDDSALISDISAPSYRYDSSGRILMEKKEDMRKRGQRSPDGADAVCLTFAESIQSQIIDRHGAPLPGRNYLGPASSAGY